MVRVKNSEVIFGQTKNYVAPSTTPPPPNSKDRQIMKMTLAQPCVTRGNNWAEHKD